MSVFSEVRPISRFGDLALQSRAVPPDGDAAPLGLLELVRDQVVAGFDVVLYDDFGGGEASLDPVAAILEEARSRVLRVDAAHVGRSLPELMARLAGHADAAALDEDAIAAGLQRLTVLDETCSRIALLVGNAHLLQRPALRYVQLACGASPDLRLVLAGKHGFLHQLADEQLAPLQSRLEAGSAFTLTSAHVAPLLPPQPAPAPRPDRPDDPATDVVVPFAPRQPAPDGTAEKAAVRRRPVLWAGLGLGAVAAASVGLFLGWPAQRGQLPQRAAVAALPPSPVPSTLPAPGPQPTGILLGAAAAAEAAALPQPLPQQAVASGTTEVGNVPPAPPPASPPAAVATAAIIPPAETILRPGAPSQPSAAPPAVGPSRHAETRPGDSRPSPQGAVARRTQPAQPRVAAARSAPPDARFRGEQREPPFWPPYGGVPEPPPRPSPYAWWARPTADPYQSRPYIGTYSVDANGVRSFRFSQ